MFPFRRGPWATPDFVRLWAGETVSLFGTLAGGIALQLTAIVYLDASAVAVSVLALCSLLPAFVLGLVAGVWVDRLRRRPVMIAADLGQMAVLLTIPVAAAFGVLDMAQLFIVAAVTSACGVFFMTAYEAYLPTLVSRRHLVEANSAMTASGSVAEVASFGAAGWLAQLLTAPGAVAVDAVTFGWSALCLSRIRTPEPAPAPTAERPSAIREALHGVRFVFHQPVLRTLAIADAIQQFGGRIISVVVLLYLVDEVGFSPGVLGMIFAIGGITSLAGAWLAAQANRTERLGLWMGVAAVVRAAGTLFMPLAVGVNAAGYGALAASQVVTDPAWTFYEIHETSLRQSLSPDAVLGRVRATTRFVGFGAMLLGTVAAGILGEVMGLRETLFVASGTMCLAALVIVVSPVARLRNPYRSEEMDSRSSPLAAGDTMTP